MTLPQSLRNRSTLRAPGRTSAPFVSAFIALPAPAVIEIVTLLRTNQAYRALPSASATLTVRGRDSPAERGDLGAGLCVGLNLSGLLRVCWVSKEAIMDKEHVKGAADKAKGAVKDTAGQLMDDKKLQAEGKMDKAKGEARQALGRRQGRR